MSHNLVFEDRHQGQGDSIRFTESVDQPLLVPSVDSVECPLVNMSDGGSVARVLITNPNAGLW